MVQPVIMKALTLFFAATTLVSLISLAWLLGTPAPADPRVAKLETELKEARLTIAQMRRDLAARPASLPATPAPSPKTLQASPAIEAPAATRSPQATTAGALREMLKNPAMRDLLGQQQAVQIETGYARLFEYLKLSDEEKAHFKKLLVERAKTEADLGLKLLDSSLTPEQRSQIIAEGEKNKKAYDETIRGFLNDESDWGAFQKYESTRPERTQFETMGRSLFTASGEPLSTQQEDQLIDLMAQVRQNPTPEQSQLARAMSNPAQMTDANLKSLLEFQRASNARILQQAAGFLSPEQLKTLQAYQEQTLGTMESGYRMGTMLLQGRKP
ncbi:MAG: hypothetical protein CJBNEKGG_02025 [Prosthecobacter sp.]|nr:hypothetical protein [Prosthecobacter sp.]